MGFDAKNMVIGVKKYDGKKNAKSYKFYSRVKNGRVRIGCKDFVKYLSNLTGMTFKPAKRYVAQYDSEAQILYISLTKKYLIALRTVTPVSVQNNVMNDDESYF